MKRFPILLGGLLLFLNVCLGQTTLTTTFANNNGSGQVTFNFQNTNTYPVVISSISSVCGSNATQTVQAWYRTTPLTGLPGAPTAANGWIQFGSGTITGILNNTTTTPQVFFPTGTSTLTPLTIPAGATYAISISATSLRYGNLTAGTYTATGGGCNLITGTNIGYGGTVAPNAATIANRGFIGSVTFIIPVATPAAPTLSNTPTCAAGAILAPTGLPAAGVTWYWQTSATGTSTAQIAATSTTATNLTVFSNATYFLRAQDNVSAAWSGASSLVVSTIPTGPANPPAPTAAINPACSPGTTITSSTAPTGTTYYWQTSTIGTSTAQVADNGSTNIPLSVTTTGTYHVRAQDNTSLCWSAGTGSLPVTVLTPVVGTANVQQITSCGGAGSITVNVNSSSNTWYANDFSSTTMNATDAQLFGTPLANITGGTLVLTTAANTQSGAIQVNNPNGINSNTFTVDFDLITVGAQGADGLSYSFGGDVVPLPTGTGNGPTTTTPENGSGSFLKLSFDAYTNGTNTNGVYLMYACTTMNQAPTTAGVLGYSPNVSWTGGNNSHVNISVNALGQITVTLGNTVLFNNVQLPAAYLSANKSTWKHVICARTGGINQGHQIDNLSIQYGNVLEYSSDAGTTWQSSNYFPLVPGTYTMVTRYNTNTACPSTIGTYTLNAPPTAFTTLSNVTSICPSTNFNLSITPTFTGATYQWQVAPDVSGVPGAWTNVGTGLNTFTTSQTAASWYQCIVVCAATGLNTISTPVLVNLNSFVNCYCTPAYTFPVTDEDIRNVTVGTLNNSSICAALGTGPGSVAGGYANYTSGTGAPATPILSMGTSVPFSILVGYCGTTVFTNGVAIWIDLNQNGVFETTERLYASTASTNNNIINGVASGIATVATGRTESGNITIPLTATPGLTRMRVIAYESNVPTNPCLTTMGYGETEDYFVNLAPPPAAPPVPTIANTPTCAAGAIIAATGSPSANVTWYWQSTATATSTAQVAATSSTSNNLTVFSNGSYYINAQDNVTGLWSLTSTAIVVSTIPIGPADPANPTAAANPACSPGTTITSGTAPTGVSFYWQTNALGTSTTQIADNGTVNTPLSVTSSGTYYVRAQDNASLCWSNGTGSLAVTVLTPIAATATVQQINGCGGTGSITANVNSSSNTWYANDFSSTVINTVDAQLFGTPLANITGGTLVITAAANAQSGAIQVNNPNGINSNVFSVDFDLITVGPQGADGLSYSFGGDVVPLPTGTGNGPTTTLPENGSGSFLKLAFDAYTNGTNTNGVYLMYNCTTLSQAPATAGVLAYSPNIAWTGGNNTHVTLSVNALGQATVILGNSVLFSNVQLPAAYLTANKSTWKHVICARTGGINQGHQIDNLNIQYGNVLEYSADGGTTWQSSNYFPLTPGTYTAIVRYNTNTSCPTTIGTYTINASPTSFTTVSSVSSVCPSINFNLSLTPTFSGATYQWQTAPDVSGTPGAWVNAGTGLNTYTASQTVATWYQCIITCTATGLSTTSTPVLVSMNLAYNCPCIPGYNFPTTDEDIRNVTLGTLNNSSTCGQLGTGISSVAGAYANYASGTGAPAAPSMYASVPYPFSVLVGYCGTTVFTNAIAIWIDLNQDGTFATTERLYASAASTNTNIANGVVGTVATVATGRTESGFITIPAGSLVGLTRMRVIAYESNVPTNPCLTTMGYGEAEDYLVNILPAPPIDAAVTNAPNPNACANTTNNTINVTLTNTGTNTLAVGDVSLTLTVSGANTGTYTATNPLAFGNLGVQTVSFTGVNLSNVGTNNFSVTLTLTGDAIGSNNTTTSTNTTVALPTVTASATPSSFCSVPTASIQLNSTVTPAISTVAANYGYATASGVVLESMTGSTALLGSGVDDVASAVTTIPFTFNFGGNNYTQFSVSSNGLLGLGATTVSAALGNTLAAALTYPIIAPLWDDLHTGTNGNVTYKVIGTSPNQKLCIEWNINSFSGGGATFPFDKTFQVWLFETTNVIQLVYGAGLNVTSASVGIASANTSYQSVTTTTNTVSTTTPNNANAVWAGSGTSYIFTPPAYTYLWSPATNVSNIAIANPVISSISAPATYTLTVTNAITGCSNTATAAIAISNVSVIVSSQTNVGCFGGTTGNVTLVGSGGLAPYTYNMNGGAYQTGNGFSSLAAGTYTFGTKDANNCTNTVVATITEPTAPVSVLSSSVQNVSCNGGNNGEITLAVAGGTPNYTYNLNGGTYQSSGTFNNLVAGTYSINVKDAQNCLVNTSLTVTEPVSSVSGNTTLTHLTCNGAGNGEIIVNGSGGVSPYSYAINGGTFSTNNSFTGLAAGSYTVSVQDTNLCTYPMTVTLTEPAIVSANITAQTNVSCNGGTNGSVTVVGTGGNGTYQYALGAGTFGTTNTFSGLSQGTYTINIKDGNNCTGVLGVNITEPAVLTANAIQGAAITCNGGTTTVTVSGNGGTAPYTGTGTFTVGAGTFNYTVSDDNGCSTTTSITISEPTTLTANATQGAAIACNGGTTTVTVNGNGGTSPYTGTGTFTVGAGTHNYTITDDNGCTANTSITVSQPATSIIADAGLDVSVCLASPTTLMASASGGTGAYTYSWDNGATQGGNVAPNTTTTYTVTVTDANGCADTDDMVVTVNSVTPVAAPSDGTTYIADYEVTDGAGWTHYYDENGTPGSTCDDYLLLSIQKNGNVIGNVGSGVFQVALGAIPGVAHITNPPAPYVMALDWYVMNRYWTVTPTVQPTSDVAVRFYYTTADFDSVDNTPASAVSAHTDLKFYKINGYNANPATGHAGVPAATAYNLSGYWQYDYNATASTTTWAYANLGGNSHYAEYEVAIFSGGGGGGGGVSGAFPVEILTFEGYEASENNVLEWVSVNEINNKGFQLLKSTDNVAFEALEMVPSKAANGSSQSNLSYQYTDKTPAEKTYYRLKTIDLDGAEHLYAKTVEITRMNEEFASVVLYPNPAQAVLNVAITSPSTKAYKLKVYDIAGKLLATQNEWVTAGGHICELNVSKLAKGTYTLMILDEDNVRAYQFVKE